jgi:hypothetical protein
VLFGQDFNYNGYVKSLSETGVAGIKAQLFAKRTSAYELTMPAYAGQNTGGTVIPSSDDVTHGPFNIGFTFTFFGNNFTQFYVGSNGWIGFSANQTTGYVAQFIPNAGSPKNAILADWEDLLPGSANIYYQTIGTAPNRKLVVSFNNVPHYGCRSNLHTFQFVLYETTNVIDINTVSKPLCNGNNATQGLVNSAGTTVVPVDGRNASQWSVNVGETKRFTPDSPDIDWVLKSTKYTTSAGLYNFSALGLDINNYTFKIDVTAPTGVSTQFGTTDAAEVADIIIGKTAIQSKFFYTWDVNSDGLITVSDLYNCYAKKNGLTNTFNVPVSRLFTQTEANTIKLGVTNTRSTLPGLQTITINTPANNGTSTIYIIQSGYSNPSSLTYTY